MSDIIKNNNSLTLLSLSIAYITDTNAELIAHSIAETQAPLTLDFLYSEIGEPGTRSIVDAIRKSLSVEKIRMNSSAAPRMVAEIEHHLRMRSDVKPIFLLMRTGAADPQSIFANMPRELAELIITLLLDACL